MHVFIAALIGGFATVLSSFVGRVLLALGIGYVAYKGFDVLFINIANLIKQHLNSGTAEMVGLLGYFWVDKAVSVILSAYALKLAYNSFGGVIKKTVIK